MPDYRRAWHPGGTYFFTVNLLQRNGNNLLTQHVDVHGLVERGIYPSDWAGGDGTPLRYMA